MIRYSDKIHIKTKDFLVSGEPFSLIWDEQMKLLKTVPAPAEENLSKYYDSTQYISHTDSNKGVINFLYQLVKNYSIKKKLKLSKRLNKGHGNLLDVGAGTGEFLKHAKDKNWKVHGVELNEKARALSLKKGVLLEKSLDSFRGKKFNVVTLWHVLEHLHNLENTVAQLEDLVKKGGSLIIAVPNFNSYDAKYYKEFWAAYDVPRHLWHFSQESMGLLFSSKMKLIKTKPMVFDAFYVSLLSEKYRTGKSFSPKAIWIGLCSNILAWNSKEYSSLIYVFRKAE